MLDSKDVPTGTAVLILSQVLGSALFLQAGQSVFTNRLVELVPKYAPGLDPRFVLEAGATAISRVIPSDLALGVQQAYSEALTRAFLVSTILAALTIIGSACMEWKSVKEKKIEMAVA